MTNHALATARSYHGAWTGHDFGMAASLLSPSLEVEVPINDYPTKESFAQAVAGFGSMARNVVVLSEMASGDEAMLLYDMDVEGLGPMRVAEHFTVRDGQIARIRQIHDTAALREAAPGYASSLTIEAAPERLFESIATAEGVRGWWTALAEGSEAEGSELRLGFEGMDERIVMRVDRLERPRVVAWTCLEHTGCEAWRGSTIRFELAEGDDGTELRFRHDGVPAELVEAGWERFLASLVALAESGSGTPFGRG